MDLTDFNSSWPSQIMFTVTTGYVTGMQMVFHINENSCMVLPSKKKKQSDTNRCLTNI